MHANIFQLNVKKKQKNKKTKNQKKTQYAGNLYSQSEKRLLNYKMNLILFFTGEIDNTRYGYKDVEMVHKIIDEMCKQIGLKY